MDYKDLQKSSSALSPHAAPLFLALKAQLYDYDKLQAEFSGLIKGRWVADENIHITLAYFGDRYSVDELLEKLPPLIVPIEPLKLSGLGYFESNRVLYAKSGSSELEKLNGSIADSFSLVQAKPFIPHATLMRIKTVEDKRAFENMVSDYENREIGRVETTFQLMRSHIKHPGGAIYESIKSFEL